MVNYRTSEILNSGVPFNTNDHKIFKPGKNRGQIVQDDQLISEFINNLGNEVSSHGAFVEYPHAGVLNTQAFLNRYPSTETNRNRARARWTLFHFLGFDIEKSAQRTTDPEALADTNNPTMNNPNCSVCHSIHDPIGGTFQNYGNEGYFRDQWGGNDSLPDTYKHPEWFDENAEPSEYQEGDTWYRSMRTPGFDGKIAPDPASSLPWLAEQIASDPRFATAAVKFWWPALMGSNTLSAPQEASDANFAQRLAAFEEQNAFIEDLGGKFSKGINGGTPFNGKDLLTELIMSPWFRASNIADSNDNGMAELISEYGTRRLLTPEELELKSKDLLGWTWGAWENHYSYDGVDTNMLDRFGIYYGGIDSNGIKTRSSALTPLMVNVAEKMALEMACPAVVTDFHRDDSDRLLFAGIEKSITPATEFARSFEVTPDQYSKREIYSLTGQLSASQKTISIRFENDFWSEEEGDRNLKLGTLTIINSAGDTLQEIDLVKLAQIPGSIIECGGPQWNPETNLSDHFTLWGTCTISLPIEIPEADSYTINIIAWGDQAGPDPVSMTVALGDNGSLIDGTSVGALIIKNKLIELHQKLLGQSVTLDEPALETSYLLLVET